METAVKGLGVYPIDGNNSQARKTCAPTRADGLHTFRLCGEDGADHGARRPVCASWHARGRGPSRRLEPLPRVFGCQRTTS